MKTIILVLFLVVTFNCKAQFSSNPQNPLIICDAANDQSSVRSLRDQDGGSYVVWLDNRDNGFTKVYAQHLDINGNKLLANQGIRIDQSTINVYDYKIIPWENGFLMAWFENQSALKAQYLDSNLAPIWSNPILIAKPADGAIYVTGGNNFNIFPTSTGATFTYTITWTGGSNLFGFNKIDFNGNLIWNNLAYKFALNGYDYASVADNEDGWYALSKGNGITSQITAHRFNSNGELMWDKLFVSAGPEGMGGPINIMTNDENDFYIVWTSANNRIMACKLLNNGTYAWSTPRIILSDTNSASSKSFARIKNEEVIVAYQVPFGANVGLQMQKINSEGQPLWGTNGVLVDTVNGYYFNPKFAFNDSNMLTVFYPPIGNSFGAQKLNGSGQNVWPDGIYLSNKYLAGNFYQDFSPIDDEDECSSVFWTGLDKQIYGGKTCTKTVTAIKSISSKYNISIYPNPTIDQITIQLPELEKNAHLDVFNLIGERILEKDLNTSSNHIQTDSWAKGIYAFSIVINKNIQTYKVLIQ